MLSIAAWACASSTLDARLREGDLDGALAILQAEDVRRQPEAMLQMALRLRERGRPGDSAASRELLEELVRERPEEPEGRTARALLRLEAELSETRDTLAALSARARVTEAESSQWAARVRQLERDMALRDSLVNLLTRTAARLETELAAEHRELEQLQRTLEQLMEVDLDRPPVPVPPEPVPPPADGVR